MKRETPRTTTLSSSVVDRDRCGHEKALACVRMSWAERVLCRADIEVTNEHAASGRQLRRADREKEVCGPGGHSLDG